MNNWFDVKTFLFLCPSGWCHYQGVCLCHPRPATNIAGQQEGHNVIMSKKYKFHICISQKNQRNTKNIWKYVLHLWGCLCHHDLPPWQGACQQCRQCHCLCTFEKAQWRKAGGGANNADNVTANATVCAKDLPESASDKTPWSEIKVSEQTNLLNLNVLSFSSIFLPLRKLVSKYEPGTTKDKCLCIQKIFGLHGLRRYTVEKQ